jgi:hypothetical protein
MERMRNDNLQGNIAVLGEKPAVLSLCPPSPVWTTLGLNPVLSAKNPVANRLSCGKEQHLNTSLYFSVIQIMLSGVSTFTWVLGGA